MALDTAVSETIAFLLSTKGLILLAVIGAFVGLLFGLKGVKKFKPFEGMALEDIIRKRIKQKAGLVGIKKDKQLYRGFEEIGFIIKTCRMPETKLEWEQWTHAKDDKTKKELKTLEHKLPEAFVYLITKKDIISRVLGMFGMGIKYVFVTKDMIDVEYDKLIRLKKDVDFDYLGGAYIPNGTGKEYIRHLGDLKIWEDSLEEFANMIKKTSYYDRYHTQRVDIREQAARIEKAKWQESQKDLVG